MIKISGPGLIHISRKFFDISSPALHCKNCSHQVPDPPAGLDPLHKTDVLPRDCTDKCRLSLRSRAAASLRSRVVEISENPVAEQLRE